tara:strand:+ start:983 stop:1213 length:231 start_codon:yes stop_codon:yes gene_type:complete
MIAKPLFRCLSRSARMGQLVTSTTDVLLEVASSIVSKSSNLSQVAKMVNQPKVDKSRLYMNIVPVFGRREMVAWQR